MTTTTVAVEDVPTELRSRVLAATGNATYRHIEEQQQDDAPTAFTVTALSGDRVVLMQLHLRENESVSEETTTFLLADVENVELGPDTAVIEATLGATPQMFTIPAEAGEFLATAVQDRSE